MGLVFFGTTAFILNNGGIANRTGSPGETTCVACHSGGAGTTIISISATPSFSANQFVIGQTYTVSCTVSNSAFTKFGFDAEILDVSNVNAGNITAGLSGVQIINATRRNVTQTTPKTGSGSAVFEFVWVAPLSGNATIYVARIRRDDGQFAMARPCFACRKLLISKRTLKVYYTINHSQYGVWNPLLDTDSVYQF